MTKWTLLGAGMLAASLASPALAQAVVDDPGWCAQFYPNANCQNYGPGNPFYPGHGWYTGSGPVNMHVRHPRHHHRHQSRE
jgi:hypothetical protein